MTNLVMDRNKGFGIRGTLKGTSEQGIRRRKRDLGWDLGMPSEGAFIPFYGTPFYFTFNFVLLIIHKFINLSLLKQFLSFNYIIMKRFRSIIKCEILNLIC